VKRPGAACAVCQCRFGSGNCVTITGAGTDDDPYVADPRLDDDDAQLAECGPAGLAVFAPDYILDPPAVHVYRTIDQTIPYDAAQPLFFNAERYDTDSMHDSEKELSRLTFKTPGVYLLTLNVRWKKVDVTGGDVAAFIRRQGADFLAIDSMPIGDADLFMSHSMSVEAEFTAGEYVEALVKQDGVDDDGPVSLPVLSDYGLPSFAAVFVRPATS
jgi:hypothetical protein